MAYQSEIEKLESRFREKPEQWFAALADAYRKAGDLDMALDVLNAWIGKRPNYSSGHIVLGRCLLDRGQDADAAEAFENVLTLDMENVIALKSLSEIAERQADMDGARRWLQRLLEVDPMNEEARAALDGLGGEDAVRRPEREQPAILDVGEPDDAELVVEQLPSLEFEDQESAMEGLEPTALELERASESPDAPLGFEPTASDTSGGPPSVGVPKDVVRELAGLGVEPIEPAIEDLAVGADEPPVIEPVAPLEPDDAVEAPEEPIAEPQLESAEFMVSEDDVADVQPIEGITFEEGAMKAPIEERTDGDLALEPEPEPEPIELAAPEPAEADVAPIEGLTIGDAPLADEVAAAEDIPEVEFVQPPVPELQPEPAADVEAETAATEEELEELPLILPEEVSAELDEPAIREPEPVVTETMAELYASQGLYAEARDIYRELLDQDPRDARLRERLEQLDEEAAGRPSTDERSRRQRYAAAATGGVSVGSMLRELLGGPAAEPELPASRGSSETAARSGGAGPAPAGSPADTSEKGEKEFSFDEFFGMPKSGTDEPRGSDDDDEPEDGFRDWLKGLRK